MTCAVAGCDRPIRVVTKALCNMHYQRLWKHGDVAIDKRSERRPLAERFWEKVSRGTEKECWNWTARSTVRGYGYLQRGGRRGGRILAHRLSWELVHGEIPDGMSICHTCDNPRCCNPDHLFLGTAADNHADMVRKGRAYFTFHEKPELVRGEGNVTSKLDSDKVQKIRELSASGWSNQEIATRFGVTRQNIRFVVNGITWKE